MNIKREFSKLNRRDHYLIMDQEFSAFRNVIDIGAHWGIFTTIARVRFPNAIIYSYEPFEENFKKLRESTEMFYDVSIFNNALGDGVKVSLANEGDRAADLVFIESSSNDAIQTKRLTDIFEENSINPKDDVLLKIDCEGGESVLLDGHADHIIKECKQISMEVHFKGPKCDRSAYFRPWEEYNNWIHNFSDTHDITYHISSKTRGYGHYILKKVTL